MKRYILSFLFLLLVYFTANAQSLSVESFKLLEKDLTANTHGTTEYDQNGEVAALIKVVTSDIGFSFDGGMVGVVKTIQKTGEIWVYVPNGIQKITIAHQQLGVLRDYYFPINIDKARTYELKLTSSTARSLVEVTPTSQFVVFKVQPHNAVIYVDDELKSLDEEGFLSLRLPLGNHTYSILAPSFLPESGVIEVKNEKITKVVSLTSSKASLTINTVPDASIWINDKEMGSGFWNGYLDAGVYLVEARKPSCRTVFQEITLSQQEHKEVTIASPEPIYGRLELTGSPVECDYYIDGNKKGNTPDMINKILIGNHNLVIKKDGYIDASYQVVIIENELTTINYSLKKGKTDNNELIVESMTNDVLEIKPDDTKRFSKIDRHRGDLYWEDTGEELSSTEYITVLEDELYRTFEKAHKKYIKGRTVMIVGLGCLGGASLLSALGSVDNIDNNIYYVSGCAGLGGAISLIVGLKIKGNAKREIENIKNEYNSGHNLSWQINVAPSIMMTAQQNLGVGMSAVLSF